MMFILGGTNHKYRKHSFILRYILYSILDRSDNQYVSGTIYSKCIIKIVMVIIMVLSHNDTSEELTSQAGIISLHFIYLNLSTRQHCLERSHQK